ncbi:MAG: alpha/beta hydrolase [Sneathiellales bacterium]|nr:alpha/beta hydrolase [Sneathiellales bacterium]
MFNKLVEISLKLLPNAISIKLIRKLAGRVKPLKVSEEIRDLISVSEPLSLGPKGHLRAWSFGKGPTVILVHGWGGQASQMATLASEISKKGFRTVIFDVTGHGDASKSYTQWDYFIRDIVDLSQSLGNEIYAYIGHSAGGMTMMAAHHLGRIEAEKLICICAPSYPFPPVRGVRSRLNPSESLIRLFKEGIAAQFEIPWQELKSSHFYTEPRAKLKLIYDKKDKFVPHSEGDKLHNLCEGSSLTKTESHGHTRILAADELQDLVLDFLKDSQNAINKPQLSSLKRQ